MSQIISIFILVLLAWGIIFVLLRLLGIITWHLGWVLTPVWIAIALYVAMLVVAAALGMRKG